MENLICLNSNTYHGYSLEEAVRGAAKAGYRYIELAAVRGYTEHLKWEMSDEELNAAKALLAENGITCIALAAHSNLMTDEGVASFERSIELAAKMGARYIVTATGETHGDHDVIEEDEKLLAVLRPLVKACEAKGIALVIETHGNNYATGQDLKALTSKLGSDFLAVNYDTANVIFYGNTPPYEDLEQSADAVKFIHLKDKLGHNQEWNFPAVGHGNLDFARIFGILQATGCTAPLSVEVEFTPAGPADLAEVDQAVLDSFNSIQRLLSTQ